MFLGAHMATTAVSVTQRILDLLASQCRFETPRSQESLLSPDDLEQLHDLQDLLLCFGEVLELKSNSEKPI